MSDLTDKINNAHVTGKTIILNEDDGSSHFIHPHEKIEIVKGNECEYVEVNRGNSTILYNLSKLKSLELN